MEGQTIDATLAATYENLRGSFEPDFSPPEGQSAAAEPEPSELEVPEAEQSEATEPEVTPGATEQPEAPAEPEQAPAFKPPWKKAALAEWEKLPDLARKEIERRENDFHKGIEQYKQDAATAKEWERTISPYLATIQTLGASPIQAAAQLFQADHLLRYSPMQQKLQLGLKILNDYGLDLPTLAQGIQQIAGEKVWEQQNPADPHVRRLEQELAQLKQERQQEKQSVQSQENSAIEAAIAEFAADPDHEHFQILMPLMGQLIGNGHAKNMDDAYEMALRQHPQTYQIWLAQQQQKWDDERKAQVQKAKKAAANNVRPNGRASVPSAPAARTMEEDIEAKARELGLLN
jgi:hypothetical protein